MPKLWELGERHLLQLIMKKFSWPQDVVLPPGDDASGLWFNGLLITSVDMLVWSTDVPPGMNHYQAGWKAVVSAISDVASKGGQSRYILLSLALNPHTELEQFEQLLEGAEKASHEYGAKVIGGDLNEADTTCISVTVLGCAKNVMSRAGVKPGDTLAVTGLFGKTFAGLHAVMNNVKADPGLLEAIYLPRARMREGIALASSGGVSACIDSSDGLGESLYLLAETNNVGFVVDRLPIDPLAEKYCVDNWLNRVDAVFYGGEEYELVYTVKKGWENIVENALSRVGASFIRIGRATAMQGVQLLDQGRVVEISRKGWQHFQRRR
uniref:Thiamine-monophosphate kinase n=1 Tax=Caldiarchaeum subterraneum TaxID=311458 RepID=A0A7C5Y824_CALS0